MDPIYPNVKEILGKMYTGRCSVYVKKYKQINGIEQPFEEQLYSDIPCQKTSDSVPIASDGAVADISQKITLILDRDYPIPPGSKIVLTQWDVTQEFTNSGEPDYYLSHQEIPIKLIETTA